jgi:hypothetical protein
MAVVIGCASQATQAFQAGNAALAKDLSAKGRHHADQMKVRVNLPL